MSTNSNFKKNKCWSCEFYCGKREYKRNFFLGDSVYTDGRGTCSNKRSEKSGKEVYEDGWCSRYQKWGVLQSAIAIKEQKLASQRIEAEQRQEMQRVQDENERCEREIENERRRLEQEREQLEYERWYSTLSPEDREAEDARIIEEKRRTQERIEEVRRSIENRKQEAIKAAKIRKAKTKKTFIIVGIVVASLTVVITSTTLIANAISKNAFANSDTGKLIALIRKETNGKDDFYFSIYRDEGCTATFGFEYKKNGWIDEYNYTRDFRVYCQLTARSEDHYTKTTGFCFFSLDGSDDKKTSHHNGKGACFTSYTIYGEDSYVLTQYQSVSYSNSSNKINYGGTYYRYENWNSSYNNYRNEWTERGFVACNLVNILVNQYCTNAFGSIFWK